MTIVDDAVMDQASRNLVARSEAVRKVTLGLTLEKTFSLNEIRRGVADDGISSCLSREAWPYPGSQPTLYVISAGDEETLGHLLNEFPVQKTRDFAGPRVNVRAEGSTTLYVGSSENVQKRLREHLWQAHAKTYALHLGRWCKVTEGAVIVRVQPIVKSTDRAVRQDLEDTVWNRLHPALGKSGGR